MQVLVKGEKRRQLLENALNNEEQKSRESKNELGEAIEEMKEEF